MAPKKRTTRASPATTTTTITPVTNAQLKALIEQGIADALATSDADRIQNGDDNHNSRTNSRRTERDALENQVKFTTCTLYGVTLTWWKSHVKTVGHDAAYNELALLCGRMFPEESDKIEKYVGGLLDMIHRSVMESKPKTMQDTNTGRADTPGPREKKPYRVSKPLYSKCNYHHDGLCAPKCHKCNRVGHLACDCRSPAATNNQRNLTCYECGNQGHYRSDFPELKNQNHRNQAEGTRACGMVRNLGGGETNQDLNNMKDDINS
uniref:CCHC-type domain-containing protein n=1 Tax=Tanacetum cinerariifolium TaxID=118510 RepID=A0A6L2MEE2_TANCI|nr:hypothetical protein [Tanacetum cinerariifolium]